MDFVQLHRRAVEVRQKYAALERKKYGREWTTEQIVQGMVGDVGDLVKLVMAKQGIRDIENANEKLAHELADCLWSVLIIANNYGIDIEKSFFATMDELEKGIDSKSR